MFVNHAYSVGSFCPGSAGKISNQLYYLQEARANISYAKNYADSTQVTQAIDSMDVMMGRLISYLEAMVVEAPQEVAPNEEEVVIEEAPTEPPTYEENQETNTEIENGGDMGLGNPIIDKFNPFKKMKSKIIIETGLNNFFMSLSTNGSEPIVSPGSSWFWNFGLVKNRAALQQVKYRSWCNLFEKPI